MLGRLKIMFLLLDISQTRFASHQTRKIMPHNCVDVKAIIKISFDSTSCQHISANMDPESREKTGKSEGLQTQFCRNCKPTTVLIVLCKERKRSVKKLFSKCHQKAYVSITITKCCSIKKKMCILMETLF